MTDSYIIEMSERCIRGNECDKCLYYELGRPDCMSAIIGCQKAEIERLREDNEALNDAIDSALDIVNGNYEIGRIAGIKEFAELLKNKDGNDFVKSDYESRDEIYWFDQLEYENFVDNLVKEKVGKE